MAQRWQHRGGCSARLSHPKKVGELKVPGFSSYIHPIDDRYLLTIGQYVPENGDWRFRAVKLSVFDVSAGISPVGAIHMNDVYQTIDIRDWSYSWAPWIRRSVMADDCAYAISDAGIRVADVGSPSYE